YEWDLDGDGCVDAKGVKVSYVYNEPGSYAVKLTVIDDDNAKAVAVRKISVLRRELPDLKVIEVSHPLHIYEYKTISFKIAIGNEGNTDAGEFNVSLLINDVPVRSTRVNGLRAGDKFTVSFDWLALKAGMYNVTVCADVLNEVKELSEVNNCLSREILVLSSPPKLIVSFRLEPSLVVLDKPFVLYVTVKNVGGNKAEGVRALAELQSCVEPYMGFRQEIGLRDLEPGESDEAGWSLKGVLHGRCFVRVRVWAGNAEEVVREAHFEIKLPPRLSIIGKEMQVQPNTVFRLSVTVVNTGDVVAKEVKVAVKLPPEGISLIPGESVERSIPYLRPGEGSEVWWYLKPVKEGSYLITITAGAENVEDVERGLLVIVKS
ncbi:MAG: hypothetical protein DRJ41_02670, partial [Thermoprotei archaeon]